MPVDRILERGIVIVDGIEVVRSVTIDAGIIEGIYEPGSEPPASERISCEGLYILPGVIDIHVHMRDLEQDDKEEFSTGTMAAAAGGVTTVVDMPNSVPPTITHKDLEEKIAIATEKRYVNVGFYAGIPSKIRHVEERLIPQILGFKVYPHAPLTEGTHYTRERLRECMKLSAEYGIPLLFHPASAEIDAKPKTHDDFFQLHSCENEVESLKQFLEIKAEFYESRLHVCHVSCGTTARILLEHRAEDTLTAEVTPHHLFLTGGEFSHDDGRAKMLPPLRSPYDNEALQQGLSSTCGIDCVASDHAPHETFEKRLPFRDAESGIPGLETLLPLMLTAVFEDKVSWLDYLRVCSSGPARILGITGKGVIAKGYDADITVVSRENWEIRGRAFHSKAKITPFEGQHVKARPVITIVGGEVVYSYGGFFADPGVVGRVPLRRLR
ncbi:MAG: dihydroorotase [Candidatus Thorarchaeota archaeon]|jgi:dihydroorotase (multifunctional complex type)